MARRSTPAASKKKAAPSRATKKSRAAKPAHGRRRRGSSADAKAREAESAHSSHNERKVAYLHFTSAVSEKSVAVLLESLAQEVAKGTDEVRILIATTGGSVKQGIHAYNMMRAMPFELVTHNVGHVESIGNAVFLGGKTRYASPHATFMFHGVGFENKSGVRLDEKALQTRLSAVQAEQKRIGSIIRERTRISARDLEKLFLEALNVDADEALKRGIVHGIEEASIPPGARLLVPTRASDEG